MDDSRKLREWQIDLPIEGGEKPVYAWIVIRRYGRVIPSDEVTEKTRYDVELFRSLRGFGYGESLVASDYVDIGDDESIADLERKVADVFLQHATEQFRVAKATLDAVIWEDRYRKTDAGYRHARGVFQLDEPSEVAIRRLRGEIKDA